jgi:hypothetical protein
MSEFEPGSYDEDSVESLALITFKIMISTLFGGKSDEYLEMIQKFRDQQGGNESRS